MKRMVSVFYDGEVLRPEQPLDLAPQTRYVVTIEAAPAVPTPAPEPAPEPAPGILDDILDLSAHFGIPDLAAQHDHYLYGLPKR